VAFGYSRWMPKFVLTAEAIYAALAVLGASACGAATRSEPSVQEPSSKSVTTAPTPAPTPADPKVPSGTSESSGGGAVGAVDAGAGRGQGQKPGGSASCGASTSGPDGKGH
jgi:hypothetical protein